jgi:protein kinase-like protein/WD40 domain-containing protein
VSEDFPRGAGGLLAGLAPGSRVGGYVLEEQVGAGGMAVVFRAVDERLGRRVALKVLAPAFAADEAFRQRFIRESRAAAAVDDPHIIPVHDAGAAGGVLFIAMRYVPGGDVRTLLHREGPLAPARAAAIISPVASALDAAHAAGLVHRDVKPANMLVDVRPDRPDHVYLSDFGLSKGTLSSAGLTGSGQYLGTPDYMAPEQIEGRAVDGRTDQYALACAAFELLAGVAPFQRDQGMAVIWAHLQQQPPPLGSRRPGLPAAADEVFARALAKAPGDRYASCREFADALRSALDVAAYHSGPGAGPAAGRPAAEHPATEIAEQVGPGTGEAAIPAGLAAASTIGPVPAEAASILPAPGTPVGPGRSGRDPEGAQPTRRRRRIILTTVAGVGIVAAVVVAAAFLIGTPGASLPMRLVATFADPGSAGVYAVAFSPDGRTLAMGDDGGSTYLWDVATRSRIATLTDPGSGGVNAVAFSPVGKTLATGDGDGSTYLWDVATGSRIATLTDPKTNGVYAVAFSRDGKTLATGDLDGRTYLWDVATGSRIAALADPRSNGVNAVAFSPDGKTLATGDGDGSTYLWGAR